MYITICLIFILAIVIQISAKEVDPITFVEEKLTTFKSNLLNTTMLIKENIVAAVTRMQNKLKPIKNLFVTLADDDFCLLLLEAAILELEEEVNTAFDKCTLINNVDGVARKNSILEQQVKNDCLPEVKQEIENYMDDAVYKLNASLDELAEISNNCIENVTLTIDAEVIKAND